MPLYPIVSSYIGYNYPFSLHNIQTTGPNIASILSLYQLLELYRAMESLF
jgi:hypothetical protein